MIRACHIDFPRYIVGSDGSVTSNIFKTPKVLTPIKSGKYLALTLLDARGIPQRIYVHRLVCETFHGAAPQGHEVCHHDGIRTHNAEHNLRWGTRSQNMRDKEQHGTATIGEAHPGAKLDEERVRVLRWLHARGFPPHTLMKYFKISRMTHWRIVNRKLWTHI